MVRQGQLMTDVFRATVEELAGQVDQQVRRVREAYQALNAIESTMTSSDGMIQVTVGPQGQVRSIDLNARVYRRLSTAELADTLMRQINRATADVTERRRMG